MEIQKGNENKREREKVEKARLMCVRESVRDRMKEQERKRKRGNRARID